MVTACIPDDRDGRLCDDSRVQRRDNHEDAPQAQKRDWRSRQLRDDARAYRSAKEQLDGPFSIHGFRNELEEIISGHTLWNCRRFIELTEEKSRPTTIVAQPLTSVAVGPIAHN